MKISMIALVVCSVASVSAVAGEFDTAAANAHVAAKVSENANIAQAITSRTYNDNPKSMENIGYAKAADRADVNAAKALDAKNAAFSQVTGSALRDQIQQQQYKAMEHKTTVPNERMSDIRESVTTAPAVLSSTTLVNDVKMPQQSVVGSVTTAPAVLSSTTLVNDVKMPQQSVVGSVTTAPAVLSSTTLVNDVNMPQQSVVGSVTTAPATFNSATIATDAPRVSIENNTALQVQKVLSSVTFSTPTPQESTKAIHLNVAQVAAQRPNMPINVTINGVPQTTTAAAIAKIDPTVQVALANPATVSAQPTETINMNVTQVAAKHPDMPINVTINGVTQTATAAAIAKVDPTIQVAVAYVPAFQRTAVKGGHDSHSNHGPHVQGDNNGNSNQHANAMGAHGQNGQRSGRSAAGNF